MRKDVWERARNSSKSCGWYFFALLLNKKSIYSAFYNKSWVVSLSKWASERERKTLSEKKICHFHNKSFSIFFSSYTFLLKNFCFSHVFSRTLFFFFVSAYRRLGSRTQRKKEWIEKKYARVVVLSIFIDFHFLSFCLTHTQFY